MYKKAPDLCDFYSDEGSRLETKNMANKWTTGQLSKHENKAFVYC